MWSLCCTGDEQWACGGVQHAVRAAQGRVPESPKVSDLLFAGIKSPKLNIMFAIKKNNSLSD